jgi:hypothetical protein
LDPSGIKPENGSKHVAAEVHADEVRRLAPGEGEPKAVEIDGGGDIADGRLA